MNEVGSGGIGAVSVGISESVVLLVIVLLVLLVAVAGWKLVKVLWAMFG
jgi:hypothetical protein